MKDKNTTIIILIILLVVTNAFQLYNNYTIKKENTCDVTINAKKNNDEVLNKDKEQLKYNNWTEYLKDTEFIEASIIVTKKGEHYIYSSKEQPNPGVTKEITKEELIKVLDTLKENSGPGNNRYGKVVKGELSSGRSGAYPMVTYKYKQDGKEYYFKLHETDIDTNDENLTKILDKEVKDYQSYYLNLSKDLNTLFSDMITDNYVEGK